MKVLDEIVREQLKQSKNRESLIQLAEFTKDLLNQEDLHPDDIQWKILINHLDEMINRSKSGEKLPEMDVTLFADLSEKSLSLAEEVIRVVQNLGDNEHFLLAVHFENIQGNIS